MGKVGRHEDRAGERRLEKERGRQIESKCDEGEVMISPEINQSINHSIHPFFCIPSPRGFSYAHFSP